LAATLALVLTSTGDALLVAVALGVAAADRAAFVTVGLAALAVLGRWGTTSLAALAGGQAVIGPAGVTGSAPSVASAWLAAAALVAVAAGRRWLPATLALGVLAALVVAGPAATSPVDAVVRAAAAVVGASAAALSRRVMPRRLGVAAALALGAAGAGLALAS
jgi:hypothetical protein